MPILLVSLIFNFHMDNKKVIQQIKDEKFYNNITKQNTKNSPKIIYNFNLNTFFDNTKKPIRVISETNFSSGRFDDWSNIFLEMKKNILIGFGAQGDRFLIKQSASNGLIYAYSSSGIIGLFFYFIFSLLVLLKTLKELFLKDRKNNIEKINNILILIILMRSLLESSYAVFGIDLIILSTLLSSGEKWKLNRL